MTDGDRLPIREADDRTGAPPSAPGPNDPPDPDEAYVGQILDEEKAQVLIEQY